MNCTATNTFPSNSDITGIGARLTLYISMLLGPCTWLIAENKDRLTDAAQTCLLTTAGMIVAGTISLYTPGMGLSLIDAEMISMLSVMITFCYFSLVHFQVGLWTGWDRYFVLSHACMTAAFGLAVFGHADNFGKDACMPECLPNSAFIVRVFGQRFSATSPVVVRPFYVVLGWLSLYLIFTCIYVIGLPVIVAVLFFLKWLFPSVRGRSFPFRLFGRRYFFQVPGSVPRLPSENRRPQLHKEVFATTVALRDYLIALSSRVAAVIHFQWIWPITMLVFAGVLIVDVEQTITDNNLASLAGVNEVTFGQAMPLLLLMQQVFRAIEDPVTVWRRVQTQLRLARRDNDGQLPLTTDETRVRIPEAETQAEQGHVLGRTDRDGGPEHATSVTLRTNAR